MRPADRALAAGLIAALVGATTFARADRITAPIIFAPAPEADGAIARGAGELARAQQLARKKRFRDAAAILEPLVQEQPAALHDCNLALAYLRGGELTGAQLAWDLSRLRGPAAPDWCAGDLARDLAKALRAGHYVPVTLAVSPAGTIVTVDTYTVRDLGLIWLPPGRHTFTAQADGVPAATSTVDVAAPAARVTLTVAPPVREPDAPPAVVPPDAPLAPLAPADAAPELDVSEPDLPPPPEAPRSYWPVYAAGGTAVIGLAAGALLHGRALATKDRANALVRDTDAFASERSRFGTERALAITGYAVGAAAIGVAVWQWTRIHRDNAPADVGVVLDGDRAMFVLEGSWP